MALSLRDHIKAARLSNQAAKDKPPFEPETPKPKPASPMSMMKEIKEMVSVFPTEAWQETTELQDFDADRYLQDLQALERSLVEDVPGLPILMSSVMKNLRQYPELPHLLDDKQINVIVRAFCKRKNLEVVAPSKTGGKGGKSIATMTKGLSAHQILDML